MNTALTPEVQSNVDAGTNRLIGPGTVTYDARGNRTFLSPWALAYDGDDKVKTAEVNTTGPVVQNAVRNEYDGDG